MQEHRWCKTSLQTFTLRNDNDQPVCHLVFLCLFYTLKWCNCLNAFYCQVFVQRQKSAFPPNFVHSLDSTHMMMTAVACGEAGLLFAGKWYAIVNHEYKVPFIYISFSVVQMQYFSQIQGRKIPWIPLFLSSYFWNTACLLCTWVVLYSGLRQHGCLIHCLSFFKHSPVSLTRSLQVYMIRSGHMQLMWIKWIRFCVRDS